MTTRLFPKLTNSDLQKNKYMYSPEHIEYSLQHDFISLRILNKTQKLTPYICCKYVIFGGNDEKYGDCEEDKYIDDDDILYEQKHLTEEDLLEGHKFVALEEIKERVDQLQMLIEELRILDTNTEMVINTDKLVQTFNEQLKVWINNIEIVPVIDIDEQIQIVKEEIKKSIL